MGCFGYLCKGCGTPINGNCMTGGENCVMIHVRHGKEIGRTEGHYDEYGRVIEHEHLPEADKYRGDNDGSNGHGAICDSEFALDDSYLRLQYLRVYKSQEVTYTQYIIAVKKELRLQHGDEKAEQLWADMDTNGALEREYASLPRPTREQYSGTAAWHNRCYKQASPEKKPTLPRLIPTRISHGAGSEKNISEVRYELRQRRRFDSVELTLNKALAAFTHGRFIIRGGSLCPCVIILSTRRALYFIKVIMTPLK